MDIDAALTEIYDHYWKIKSFKVELPANVPVILSSGDPHYEAAHESAQFGLYFEGLKEGGKILDIGAGDKTIGAALQHKGIKARYLSMDTASRPELAYDYHSLEEIKDNDFDLVIMQEVIEHMPLWMGYTYLKQCYRFLNENGAIVVTSPNTRRPMRFHHSDFTHIHPYPLHDLYGLLRSIGFKGAVQVRRIEIRDPHEAPSEKIRRFILRVLYGLMDFDYTHSILVKIRKS